MKYIVQNSEGEKMMMDVVGVVPQLPEGFEVLGLAENLPEFIEEINQKSQVEAAKAEARKLLANTDWMVIRHRDQIEMGVETSLTTEEFVELLNQRQIARDSI